MSSFEYVSVLASIIVGFALSDMLRSLGMLLKARRKVRWDWAAPLTALLVTLTIIQIWWGQYQSVARPISIGEFLPLLVELVLLSLLASAIFPDAVPEEGLDLKLYYAQTSRFIWILFAAALAWLMVVGTAAAIRAGGSAAELLRGNVIEAGVFALMLSLAFVKKRWWHAVGLILLAGGPLGWLSRTLG